jgi:hypothetical protein
MDNLNIVGALEEYLRLGDLREPSNKEKKFYVSDMGKCLRVRFLKRKGIGTEMDPYVNWILRMGSLLHDFGYKALEAQGVLIEAEDSIETEHFSGRSDGKVRNQLDQKKSIFDFKSVGKWKMQKIMKGEEDEDGIAQLLDYIMLCQEAGQDISDTGLMVYLNKEPSDDVPIPFFQREYHLTNWRRKQLHEEMDKIIDFWKKDRLPPCTCPGWMKSYNSYQPFCQADGDIVKKILKDLDNGKKLISTKKVVYSWDEETKTKKEVLKI